MPNGFLGVDVFFALSGYVITNQLLRDLKKGQFSFIEFYKRRIRRILPLTFVVAAVTLLCASFIFLSRDFENTAQSALATSTFWANVYFWRDGGYFGGADKLKPLLHMWSLAVEEQFYIGFPALLWLIVLRLHLRTQSIAFVITALTLLSLSVHLLLVNMGGASPSFFLMPTRAWQFGIGALAALAVGYGKFKKSSAVSAVALTILLLFLWLPDVALTSQLVVTCATGIYLLFGGDGRATDRMLASPAMRYLGQRSFSIYLWHWPIVAFSYYASVGEIPLPWKAAGIGLTFVLSEVSYRVIELPFRYSFTLKAVLALIATCGVTMGVIYYFVTMNSADDLEGRIARQIQTNFRCSVTDYIPYGGSRACVIKAGRAGQNVAVLGNSHAQMYAPAIVTVYAGSDKGIILVPLNGCPPTPEINISQDCAAKAKKNLDALLADRTVSTVYIGTTYEHDALVHADGTILEDPDGRKFAIAVVGLVRTIETSGKNVRVIGPIFTPGYDFPSEISRRLRFGWLSDQAARRAFEVPRKDYEARYGIILGILSNQLQSKLIRPAEKLCDEHKCRFADEGGSYFADSGHISSYGVYLVRPAFSAD